jgi:hypothetical protein
MGSIKAALRFRWLSRAALWVVACGLLISAFGLPREVHGQAPPADWKAFLKKVARNQDLSGAYRDRCVYQMNVTVTRYKNNNRDWREEIVARRKSTIEAAPNAKGEVQTRMLTDTDDNGRPRKADPKERYLLGTAGFLDALFFPFYPEKVAHYDLGPTEFVEENGQTLLSVAFIPMSKTATTPLIEGTGYFLQSTGELVKLEIKSLRNFTILGKELEKLQGFEATVEYAPAGDGLRVPVRATGHGVGRLKQLEGMFRFSYEEAGHVKSTLYK